MGGGGHHHHHHHVPKVPDYRIYKVENIPELMTVKKALAAKGLKDPWLRNEVWKYDIKNRGTPGLIFRKTLGRGMAVGFGLAVVTAIAGKFLEDDHHGHEDGASHH